jgi:hypothetical protein
MGNVPAAMKCGWGGACPTAGQAGRAANTGRVGRNRFTNYAKDEEEGYQDYDEEEYRNYGRNNPFAMFSLVVFYLVIALSIYAFTCKKSYLTPTNMGIGLILLLVTGGSAMS